MNSLCRYAVTTITNYIGTATKPPGGRTCMSLPPTLQGSFGKRHPFNRGRSQPSPPVLNDPDRCSAGLDLGLPIQRQMIGIFGHLNLWLATALV
jgi:hypothetical protein